jgi:hypothetical protein
MRSRARCGRTGEPVTSAWWRMRTKDNSGLHGRRRALTWIAGALTPPGVWAGLLARRSSPVAGAEPVPHSSPVTRFAPVVPGYRIRFPQDEGSHPAFRTEWWYVTGWLEAPTRKPFGFQITFFRARAEIDETNPSAFTPRQVMIAHAALSDAARGRPRARSEARPRRAGPRRRRRRSRTRVAR